MSSPRPPQTVTERPFPSQPPNPFIISVDTHLVRANKTFLFLLQQSSSLISSLVGCQVSLDERCRLLQEDSTGLQDHQWSSAQSQPAAQAKHVSTILYELWLRVEQRQTRRQTLPYVCRAADVEDAETVRITSTSSDANI